MSMQVTAAYRMISGCMHTADACVRRRVRRHAETYAGMDQLFWTCRNLRRYLPSRPRSSQTKADRTTRETGGNTMNTSVHMHASLCTHTTCAHVCTLINIARTTVPNAIQAAAARLDL